MTLKQFIDWANQLPPEMQEAEMCSTVGGMALNAKRVVAYSGADGDLGIVVNSAGTHLGDAFWDESNVVSMLHCDGTAHTPEKQS